MSDAQPPLAYRGGLTDTLWVATRYRARLDGTVEVFEKREWREGDPLPVTDGKDGS